MLIIGIIRCMGFRECHLGTTKRDFNTLAPRSRFPSLLPQWQSFVLTAHRGPADRYTCPYRSNNVSSWTGQFTHQPTRENFTRPDLSLVLLITTEVCCIYLFNVLRWKEPALSSWIIYPSVNEGYSRRTVAV